MTSCNLSGMVLKNAYELPGLCSTGENILINMCRVGNDFTIRTKENGIFVGEPAFWPSE